MTTPPQTLADLADHCRTQAAEWDWWELKVRRLPHDVELRERAAREAADHAADWRALAELCEWTCTRADLAGAPQPEQLVAAARRLANRLETP